MKKKIDYLILFFAMLVGSFVGQLTYHLMFPQKKHLCTCELCKSIRQLEAAEMVDSIIKERIVINVNKE